jgi:hypothetical protein
MSLFLALSVTSLRRTIMSLLEEQRTLIGTGAKCIGREDPFRSWASAQISIRQQIAQGVLQHSRAECEEQLPSPRYFRQE